jgi:nucleoside-diphosphate-sugar epimerase
MSLSCLVTGGCGFIGSHLVDRLLRDGHSVRVLDNLSTGFRRNLDGAASEAEVVEGDVRDLSLLRSAARGIDVVFHQAALPSVARSLADPILTHENNATGTLNVLVAARDAGVKRVVCASSSSLYGDAAVERKREDLPAAPRSPYAVSKLAAEQYCRSFFIGYGLEAVALRYFNVFGPRQDPNSAYSAVIPRFIVAMLSGQPPTIHGDGLQSRDFTYIDNVVHANLLAGFVPGVGGEVFNVARGENYSLLDLVDVLKTILGADLAPVFEQPRVGDVRHSRADISRARELLGFEPRIGFEEGLRLTVEWHQRHR